MGKLRFIGIALVAAAVACADKPSSERVTQPLPTDLAATGIDGKDVRPFAPQYALWTDGAEKRRFIHLPPGATIDATDANAWQLPVGTKLWKEFAYDGKKIETRYIERTSEGYRFATYVWSADGKTATLAPERGTTIDGHAVPARGDCKVCHGNGKTPVLGFSALQLSADRDPNAPHARPLSANALDLPALVKEGRLEGFRGTTAPRIAARTPTERAALGYLHANCGHCHRDEGALASLDMKLTDGDVAPSTIDRPSRIAPARMRIARHAPNESVLVDRMKSREPAMQMPPLGTQRVDDEGVALLTQWVSEL